MDESTMRLAREDIERQWAAMGVKDGGHLGPVKPFTIATRNAKGELEEEPIAIALVTFAQKAKARNKARQVAKDTLGLDPSFEGEDRELLRTLERIEVLCYAIREYDPKLGDDQEFPVKFADSVDLLKAVGNVEEKLSPVWTAYDNWVAMNDPRYGELSREEMWEVVRKVAATRSIDPLSGIDGQEQNACIVLMAREALLSPNAPSSPPSPSTSPSA